MARRRFHTRSGGVRRETMWISLDPVSTNYPSASSAVLTHSLSVAALALRPFTIVRTHLSVLILSDQVAASEFFQAAIGLAVVSDQASAIGVTAVPTPFTDLGSDLFFVHHSVAGRFQFISGVGIGNGVGGIFEHVDSKAMRRVNDDQDMIVVGENSGLSAGTDQLISGRILIKLH